VSPLLTRRFALALVPATLLVAIATGLPTDVLPNPWFTRMTPVRTLDLVLWPLTSVAVGALLATVVLPRGTRASGLSAGVGGGGLLSTLAIGCPVCNKLVLLALGASGAFTYFAPIQPLLGAAALALALFALRRRIAALGASCALPVHSR
jgi:hypothetical protein